MVTQHVEQKHKQNFTISFSYVYHKTIQFLVEDMNFIVVFFLSILFFIIWRFLSILSGCGKKTSKVRLEDK